MANAARGRGCRREKSPREPTFNRGAKFVPCCILPAAKHFSATKYTNSRLLGHATSLCPERGWGSLTALLVIETAAQSVSAYIPTNLNSITDGQIYFSPVLSSLRGLQTVNVGASVSRVGGEAQRAIYRAVTGNLKLLQMHWTR